LPARPERRLASLAALLLLLLALGGCGGGGGEADELRLGYFPNITHGPALIGVEEGIFAERITAMPVRPEKFVTGTEAVAAMLSGSLDASYLGMGPVITTLSRAPDSLVVLAGVSEAGAVLVVRKGAGIRSLDDLRGRSVGFPGFGNTQDLALRIELERAGVSTARTDPDLRLVRIRNADLSTAFRPGALDAALAPEPWGALLVQAGLAEVLLPADRVMDGRAPTTILVARREFAEANPEVIAQLVAANRELVGLAGDPERVADAFEQNVKGTDIDRTLLVDAVRTNVLTTRIDPVETRNLVEAARDAGYLDGPVTVEQLLPTR